jgi:plastocyanin
MLSAVALIAVLLPASARGGARVASNHTVILKNLRFNPETLRIHRGERVTWKWEDGSTPHNLKSHSFRGASTRAHGSFTVRFTRAGTFNYRCTLHSFMTGKIVVR